MDALVKHDSAVRTRRRAGGERAVLGPSMLIWLLVGLLPLPAVGDDAGPISYSRHIQPIFAQRCLTCHGPGEQKGGLRLDERARAVAAVKSGAVPIVPGQPDTSELLRRVSTADADERMPPEGEPLTRHEIDLLAGWIEAGAEYDAHWAYRPLDPGEVPELDGDAWGRHPIDRYVGARLARRGIRPSPGADRFTLIKRLSYDLLGLPPSVAEADAFARDDRPGAYEALVDRFLESPRLGERWGRHWLDKARFADSDGYEKDNNRPDAWRYRDWVIEAINNDLPYDRFVIEQMAGDLLPDATPWQRLATAFNRQTLTNTEGGADREQWRVAAVMDRTETLGSVWLGLTVGCARCHDHKYDAIRQDEYYSLYAFFNNGDETNTKVPTSRREWETYEDRRREYEKELARLEAELESHRRRLDAGLARWERTVGRKLLDEAGEPQRFEPVEIVAVSSSEEGNTFAVDDGGAIRVSGKASETATYTIAARSRTAAITGFRLDVLVDESLPGKGPGRADNGNFVLSELRVRVSAGGDDGTALPFADAVADFSQKSFPVASAIDGKAEAGTGWAVAPQLGKPHHAEFYFEDPLDFEPPLELRFELVQAHGKRHSIGKFLLRAITGQRPRDETTRQLLAALRTEPASRDAAAVEAIRRYRIARDPAATARLERLEDHRKSAPKRRELDVRVISERTKSRRQTRVLERGDFLRPAHAVAPGVLATLPPIRFRADGRRDRLDLARWLVDGVNPLPPRVIVNHVWGYLFGEGLVRTMDDFGVRGEPPTHPRLLDWLADRLIRDGWSRKKLIKHIVMSRTYRQSSRHRPELADIDPTNRLLYRQNRFRMEAEALRDLSLAASGLLSAKIGGPSVFPPIPPGITDLNYNSAFKWKTSKGEDRYRRGLYTYFKRTAPHPNLTTLDCPDSNTTTIRRGRSNTPLGALITLNNEVFAEAARALARHVLSVDPSEDGSGLEGDAARIELAFRRCVTRAPDDAELSRLAELLELARGWYGAHPQAANELRGSLRLDGATTSTELAAWTATLRIVLNLDEFLMRE